MYVHREAPNEERTGSDFLKWIRSSIKKSNLVLKRANIKLAFLWNRRLLSPKLKPGTLHRISAGTLQTAYEQWNCIICSPSAVASGSLKLKKLILSMKGLVESSDSHLFLSALGISFLSVSFLSLSFLNFIIIWTKTHLKKGQNMLKIWGISAFHCSLWFYDSIQFEKKTINRLSIQSREKEIFGQLLLNISR